MKRLNPKENKTEKHRTVPISSHICNLSIIIDVFTCTLIWPISLSNIFHYLGKTSTKASPLKCPSTSIFGHYVYVQSYVGEAQTDFYYLKPVVFLNSILFQVWHLWPSHVFNRVFKKKVNLVMKMAGEQLSNGYTSIVRITHSTVSK